MAGQSGRPFADVILNYIFLIQNVSIFIEISPKFGPKRPIKDK